MECICGGGLRKSEKWKRRPSVEAVAVSVKSLDQRLRLGLRLRGRLRGVRVVHAAIGQSTSRHAQCQTKRQKQSCQSSHQYSLLFTSCVPFDVMFLYRTTLVLSIKFLRSLNFRRVLHPCEIVVQNGTVSTGPVGRENGGHAFPARRVRVPHGSPSKTRTRCGNTIAGAWEGLWGGRVLVLHGSSRSGRNAESPPRASPGRSEGRFAMPGGPPAWRGPGADYQPGPGVPSGWGTCANGPDPLRCRSRNRTQPAGIGRAGSWPPSTQGRAMVVVSR